MKRWIHASTDISSLKKRISSELYEYITYELWHQLKNDYYKQVRKQFTVNGRKYLVRNDAKGHLNILTPEGENLYGYKTPTRLSYDKTDDMASDIINDAYGDDLDVADKKVFLNVRVGYTYNSPGKVVFGPYLDTLRRYAGHQLTYRNIDPGDVDARYVSVQIESNYANHEDLIFFSDNASELISKSKKFIQDGANSTHKNQYSYYADVIDTETGEEIYFDSAESKTGDD